ncbi:hypothetical protein [Hoeflea prorocentri]|uniref:Uncharacterized protein n=1 Tax=Hoeflea prorocentri TaxID=1922333 RepID=A0A9X3UIE8_9HYPH|nr:hypothetical protein [Hoeflea prorocentri]MCY6381005.1 hypothetical protein [Hoeflea prorocentri]MDA5398805.1 hypothetical protein [Hoeflea prorocentri]
MTDEDQTPWRERYWWEDELERTLQDRIDRALREGKHRRYYLETDPDRKITLEDCFRFIRTCQSMPEVWDSLANIHIPSPEEEAAGYEWSEEDDKRNDVSNYFLRWYAMKHHPGIRDSALLGPAAVIELYGNGMIDDLFGQEAIDYMLDTRRVEGGDQ